MYASGVHLIRAAKADMRPDLDEGRSARLFLRVMDRFADGGSIVAVCQCLDMPAIGFEPFCHVFGEGNICISFDSDMVVVGEEDEVTEREVAGDGGGLGGDTFHHIAVAADAVD